MALGVYNVYAEKQYSTHFYVQIGCYMDTTDIFLNKLYSEKKLYSSLADIFQRPDITDHNSLCSYLNSISEPVNFRVYISSEEVNDTPAEEAEHVFRTAAETNEKIDAEFIIDEFLNLIDDNNRITSQSVPRSIVHRSGMLHPTVHIWFIRRRDMGVSVLLQKRAHEKDICPDCYDVSAAGHVSQGAEFRHTALREIHEELGIEIPSNKLEFIGIRHNEHIEGDIDDSELVAVYIYRGDVHRAEMTLQESEVSEVCWAEIDELISLMKHDRIKCCVSLDELTMVKKAVY